MGDRITEFSSEHDGLHLYKRISLELSHTWPGQVYLRFEPFNGPAVMVQVMPGDIAGISMLGDLVP